MIGLVRLLAAVFASGLISLCAAGAAEATPTDLDPSFGGDGSVTASDVGEGFRTNLAYGDAVVESSGAILTVGGGGIDEPEAENGFVLIRHRADGTLDPALGSAGVVTALIPDPAPSPASTEAATARAVVRQTDGKFVVAGDTGGFDGRAIAGIARFNSDGSLDSTFGGVGNAPDGWVVADRRDANGSGLTRAEELVLLADGTFVVALFDTNRGATLVRLSSEGAKLGEVPQPEDGAGGLYTAGNGFIAVTNPRGCKEGIQPFRLTRYSSALAVDTDFGDQGMATASFRGLAADLAVQPDGQVVVAGFYSSCDSSDVGLARFEANGDPDTGFGQDGRAGLRLGDAFTPSATTVALQGDGKIVVGGTLFPASSGSLVARFTADGSPDTTFGPDGTAGRTLDPGGGGFDAAVDTLGRIVLAGGGHLRFLGDTSPVNRDGDGVPDDKDNCPALGNADQANTDADAEGNACDADDDNDGRGDSADACPLQAAATADGCPAPGGGNGNGGGGGPGPGGAGGAGSGPLLGDNGRNTLKGTEGADLICGLRGDDVIRGRGGNDTLYGGSCGAKGARSAVAAATRVAAGTDGKDRVSGGAGNDRLFGGSGNDRLDGSAGNDRVDGGAGNDRLKGGSGSDRLSGGWGHDSIDVRDGNRDRVDCGRGRDKVRADRRDRVRRCERVGRRG